MSNDDAIRSLIDEMALVLAPIVDAAQVPEDFKRLLAALGWSTSSIPAPLLELATAGKELLGALEADPDEVTAATVLVAIAKLVDAIDAIHAQPDSLFPSSVDIISFQQTIGRDLLDYCVVEYLLRHRFKVGRLLKLVGIVQLDMAPAVGLRGAYVQRRVQWNRVGTLLTDPLKGFREAYAWSTSAPQLRQAVGDLGSVLEAFGLQYSFFTPEPAQLAFINAGATVPLSAERGICLDFDDALGVPPGSEAGVRL